MRDTMWDVPTVANRSSGNVAQVKYLGMIVKGKGKVVPVLN